MTCASKRLAVRNTIPCCLEGEVPVPEWQDMFAVDYVSFLVFEVLNPSPQSCGLEVSSKYYECRCDGITAFLISGPNMIVSFGCRPRAGVSAPAR